MNERAARDVVLVRAIESADIDRAILSNDDRTHATRAATELARWRASEQRQPWSAELFVIQRAELLATTLTRRSPAIARAARAFEWPSWIGVALPALAFTLGALVEHISDRQHVNVLAFPLLVIVLWNVAIYLLLLLRLAARAGGARFDVLDVHGPRRWLAALRRRPLPNAAAESSRAFVAQWAALVTPLMAVRAARVLHLAAAMFALGAITGLYVRGLIFEYRAGWESTFLDAPAVHAILSFFLAPAAQLTGVPFPTVDEIASIRFTDGAPTGSISNAARWIHLYAVTVGAIVVVPRLALACLAAWQVRRRSHAFGFDMSEPYFRRLAGSFSGGPARLRVIPYSFTVDEAALTGLRVIATTLLGDDAEVTLHAPVAFGAEESAARGLADADQHKRITLALFTLTATPENENHGAFLKALRGALSSTRLMVLVDESGYRRRLGAQAGAEQRLAERRDAWRYFCQAISIDAAFADLVSPNVVEIERDFEHLLAAPA